MQSARGTALYENFFISEGERKPQKRNIPSNGGSGIFGVNGLFVSSK